MGCLSLDFDCMSDDIRISLFDPSNLFRRMLPKLKHLNCLVLHGIEGNIIIPQKLACLFSKQLRSLHFNKYLFINPLTNETHVHLVNFEILQELCLYQMSQNVELIMAKAPNLKRIHLKLDNAEYENIVNFFNFSLTRLQSLEYLSFDANLFTATEILKPLLNALNASNITRKDLKLKINVWKLIESDLVSDSLQSVTDYIDAITKAISKAVSNDFLLHLSIEEMTVDQIEFIEDRMKELESLYLFSYKKGIYELISRIIIQNKGNKMCGFEEKWIHKCCT